MRKLYEAVEWRVIALALVLAVTITLSNFMNIAANAAMMCPIAISTATRSRASPDAFFVVVAVGASCTFLTPLGHKKIR